MIRPPANLNAVTDIDYDAKGQRTLIDYGNGVRTTYKYDPLTFRLVRLFTIRGEKGSSDCAPVLNPRTCEDPPAICTRLSSNNCILQDLAYTYDPVGNITYIYDSAQQIIYFRNKRVEPSASYTYDALYRLIEATGREHLGQNGGGNPLPPSTTTYNDRSRIGILHPGDGNAMGTYIERYVCDAVGNFLEMQHCGSDPVYPGWSRAYAYNETSLIEDGTGSMPLKMSNRLTSTTVGTTTESYSTDGDGYDSHGNMLKMPQLQIMRWDFKDQLQMTQRQAVNAQDVEGQQCQGERTYYVYDASGQRVRKVTELANGDPKDERIYLGGFEIYRKHSGANAGLVRETLHVMDDKQRIALVETRTQGDEPRVPVQLILYQFGNHLGSASLETDHEAKTISYEEYYPYGSTSYQAVRNDIQVPLKRYRYSDKERDDESGFYYHGARYCAPWLGRWTACDPAGFVDGMNLYIYCKNRPINLSDKTGLSSDPEMVPIIIGDPNAYTDFPPPPDKTEYKLDDPNDKLLYNSMMEWWQEETNIRHNERVTRTGKGVLAFWGAFAMVTFGIPSAIMLGPSAALGLGARTYMVVESELAIAKIALEMGIGVKGAAIALGLGEAYLTAEALSQGLPMEVVNPQSLLGRGPSTAVRSGTASIGPAASIPENPGAFLERGAFGTTEGTTYIVRAGPAGKYGDFIFNSLPEAKAYATQLAKTGEAAIRRTSALPQVWPGGAQGNPVNAVNVFEVPPSTPYIQGVVGPQVEGGAVYGSPKTYPGGGPQVVIDWNARLNQVGSYPVGGARP